MLLALLTLRAASGFYLPGVAPREFRGPKVAFTDGGETSRIDVGTRRLLCATPEANDTVRYTVPYGTVPVQWTATQFCQDFVR